MNTRNGLLALLGIGIAAMLLLVGIRTYAYFEFASPYLHALIEVASAAVGIYIATFAYRSFHSTGALKMLVLGNAFLLMAILDLFHAALFAGMPQVLLPVGNPMPIYYWITSRVVGALLLFAMIFTNGTIEQAKRARTAQIALTLTVLFVAAAVFVFTAYYNQLPVVWTAEGGLTPLKIWLEYTAIGLLAVITLYYLKKYNQSGDIILWFFLVGAILTIASEYAFTNYKSAWGPFAWLGHVFKALAFAAFALFGAGLLQIPASEKIKDIYSAPKPPVRKKRR